MFKPKRKQERGLTRNEKTGSFNLESVFSVIAVICLAVSAAWGVRLDATFSEILQREHLAAQAEQQETEPPQSQYEVVRADVSWEQARTMAEEKGGHLAVITSPDEWEQIKTLLDETFGQQTTYVWLGAYRDDGGNFVWITGESWEFVDWYSGEPSGTDRDGTPERYLCTWNLNGSWSWNDQRNDVIAVVPSLKGSIGMVIEYE